MANKIEKLHEDQSKDLNRVFLSGPNLDYVNEILFPVEWSNPFGVVSSSAMTCKYSWSNSYTETCML